MVGEVVSNFWKAPKIQEISCSNLKDILLIPLHVGTFGILK